MLMSMNHNSILDYLNVVDRQYCIKPLIMGPSFWRGCLISHLILKYKLTIVEAYDILFKFTGQQYYVPGNWIIKVGANGYINDDCENWLFVNKEHAFGYQTKELAETAMKKLDSMNLALASIQLRE
jgi:hypothetical protein